ncbi:hypothetical protein FQR65_LT02395 [Abscondita terminalis]|nr:hypothetical protein FQR65_LT02395 [Abscondita terminalis]
MFRILKFRNCIKPLYNQECYAFGPKSIFFGTTQRFYAKKGDDCCRKEPTCKPPKPIAPECKPDGKLHPCAPKPVECGIHKKPLPLYHDCPTPNRMDTAPKLRCPHGTDDGNRKKSYLRGLLFGAIFLLISMGCLYYIQKPKIVIEEKKKTPLKKVRKKIPETSKEIPNEIPYLLIGGGTASFSAFRAIKSADPEARVLIISEESDFPYMRPPLSKEMWCSTDAAAKELLFTQWNGSERSLFYEPNDFFMSCEDIGNKNNNGVAVARGWSVSHLDVVERKAILEDGYEISYGQCLIATGAIPKNLEIFEKASPEIQDKISTFREVFDFQRLHQICEDAEQIVVIGGGFLGSELACALARKGMNKFGVTQIFREGGHMASILPEYLSFWTTDKVKKEGVSVIPYAEVTGVELNAQKKISLNLSNGKVLTADQVVVAVGACPNTDLAEKSNLEVDPELGGFLVNTELQARSNLYVAGDCSCFYDTKFGRRRVEHHDHAVVSGRLAGENMAGARKPYWHQSMFWSDLGPDVGYEAIGIVDAELPTVGVFAKATAEDSPEGIITETDEGLRSDNEEKCAGVPPECEPYIKTDPQQRQIAEKVRKEERKCKPGEDFGKGVIFYLRDDIVVGIVLWNVFNRMNIARQVLKDERKYDDLNEVAKLFNIHGDVEPEPEPEEEEEDKCST